METAFGAEILTVKETAQLLRIPQSWVYERTRRRNGDQIPHKKMGKYLRFEKNEVIAWFKKLPEK